MKSHGAQKSSINNKTSNKPEEKREVKEEKQISALKQEKIVEIKKTNPKEYLEQNYEFQSASLDDDLKIEENDNVDPRIIRYITQRRKENSQNVETEEKFVVNEDICDAKEREELKELIRTGKIKELGKNKKIITEKKAEPLESNINVIPDEIASSEHEDDSGEEEDKKESNQTHVRYTQTKKKCKNSYNGEVLEYYSNHCEFTDTEPEKEEIKEYSKLCTPKKTFPVSKPIKYPKRKPGKVVTNYTGSLAIPDDKKFMEMYGTLKPDIKHELEEIAVLPKDYEEKGDDIFPDISFFPKGKKVIKIGDKYYIEMIEDGFLTRIRSTEDGRKAVLVSKNKDHSKSPKKKKSTQSPLKSHSSMTEEIQKKEKEAILDKSTMKEIKVDKAEKEEQIPLEKLNKRSRRRLKKSSDKLLPPPSHFLESNEALFDNSFDEPDKAMFDNADDENLVLTPAPPLNDPFLNDEYQGSSSDDDENFIVKPEEIESLYSSQRFSNLQSNNSSEMPEEKILAKNSLLINGGFNNYEENKNEKENLSKGSFDSSNSSFSSNKQQKENVKDSPLINEKPQLPVQLNKKDQKSVGNSRKGEQQKKTSLITKAKPFKLFKPITSSVSSESDDSYSDDQSSSESKKKAEEDSHNSSYESKKKEEDNSESEKNQPMSKDDNKEEFSSDYNPHSSYSDTGDNNNEDYSKKKSPHSYSSNSSDSDRMNSLPHDEKENESQLSDKNDNKQSIEKFKEKQTTSESSSVLSTPRVNNSKLSALESSTTSSSSSTLSEGNDFNPQHRDQSVEKVPILMQKLPPVSDSSQQKTSGSFNNDSNVLVARYNPNIFYNNPDHIVIPNMVTMDSSDNEGYVPPQQYFQVKSNFPLKMSNENLNDAEGEEEEEKVETKPVKHTRDVKPKKSPPKTTKKESPAENKRIIKFKLPNSKQKIVSTKHKQTNKDEEDSSSEVEFLFKRPCKRFSCPASIGSKSKYAKKDLKKNEMHGSPVRNRPKINTSSKNPYMASSDTDNDYYSN